MCQHTARAVHAVSMSVARSLPLPPAAALTDTLATLLHLRSFTDAPGLLAALSLEPLLALLGQEQ